MIKHSEDISGNALCGAESKTFARFTIWDEAVEKGKQEKDLCERCFRILRGHHARRFCDGQKGEPLGMPGLGGPAGPGPR